MKKFLSLVLALVMVLSLGVTAGAVSFTDDAAITKDEAVGVLSGVGIINGYEAADGTFSFAPNGNITRGAAAKIICMIKLGTKVAGILSCETAPFKDVAKDSTFAPYIAYCVNEGIVSGYADGTYKPGNPVSGYAFTKMLLNALGIKGNYEGTNYGVNVALAADAAKLFEGMDADTVYSDPASREDACQLAFNALKYTPTGASSQYVVVDEATDKEVWSGTDALTALALASAQGYKLTVDTTYTGSLGDKHFGLKDSTKTDNFGRTAKTWIDKNKTTTIYATIDPKPVLTYTTATTDVKIATALGATNKTGVELTVIEDGDEKSPADVKKNSTANTIGGQGTLVEVYKTADKKYDVVVINTYVKKLAAGDFIKANAANETKAGIVLETIGEGDAAVKLTFDTTAFKANDVVLYTKGEKADSTPVIDNVVKAAYISGKVTATAADYVRVDGVQYKLAKANEKTIGQAGYTYSGAQAYTYYLDTYGNIIDEKVGETAKVDAKYTFVAGIAAKYTDNTVAGGDLFSAASNATAAAQVRVADLATGAITVKNLAIVKNTAGEYVFADETGAATNDKVADTVAALAEVGEDNFVIDAVNAVFEYYELADGSIVLGNAVELEDTTVTKGKAEVERDSVKMYTNSATKVNTMTLTFKVVDKGTVNERSVLSAASVATKTGIATKNDTLENTFVVYADKDNKIVSDIYSFVEYEAPATKTNYVFFKAVGESGKNGTGYQFYANGEVVEYIAKTGVTLSLDENAAYIVTLKGGKIDAASDVVKATASGQTKALEVVAVDSTYVLLKSAGGNPYTMYFKDTGYTVVDKDADFAADTLAVGDQVWVYGNTLGTNTITGVDLVVIDN